MQISCDPSAFLLLRFDQLATHLCKRLLGKLLIGCVNRRADKSSKRSIAVHPWGRNIEHPTVDSIASTQTVLLREWLFGLQRLIEGCQHTFYIVRMNVGDPDVAVPCVRIAACKGDSTAIDVVNPASFVAHPD